MKAYDALSDAELLRLARRDEEAFAEFYRRFAASVYAATLRRVGDAEVAVDITAEAFAQVTAADEDPERLPVGSRIET